MPFTIKRIKKGEGVLGCEVLSLVENTYIVVNRMDRLEIYDLKLACIHTIECNVYIKFINKAVMGNKEYFILLTTINTYFIVRDDKLLTIDSISKDVTKPLFENNKPSTKRPDDLEFKSSLVFKDLLLLFAYNGHVLCCTIRNGNLIYDDFPNDFKYFEVLDVSTDGNYLLFLVKDVEGTVTVLKYYSDNGRLMLKTRLSSKTNTPKKPGKDIVTLEGIKNVDTLRNGFLFTGEDYLLYEDGEEIRVEFANTFIKSKCRMGSKIIYSMEDGELIQIEILHKKPFKNRFMQSHDELASTTKETPATVAQEKIDKRIHPRVLNKFTEGFNFIKEIDKKTIVAVSNKKMYLIRIDNGHLDILGKISCVNKLQGSSFTRNMYYFWNNRILYRLAHNLETSFINIVKTEDIVQQFMVFNNTLVIGFYCKGLVIINGTDCMLETGPLLNIQKVSETKIVFNTKDDIYTIDCNGYRQHVPIKNIVLSSYYNNRVIVYTADREIIYVDLQEDNVLARKHIEVEVSSIVLFDFVLISTYNGDFKVLNLELEIVKNLHVGRTFILYKIHQNRLFVSDTDFGVYECQVNDNLKINFTTLYQSQTPIIELSSLKNFLCVVSEDSILIDLKKQTREKISLPGITNACYEDHFYFAKARKIITCNINNLADYSFNQNGSINAKDPFSFDVIFHEAKENLTVLYDKVLNTTHIQRDCKDLITINKFCCTSGVFFKSHIVLCGYSEESNLCIAIGLNKKGKIVDLQNDKSIKILCKAINSVVSCSVNQDTLVVCDTNNIMLHNSTLTNTSTFTTDLTIDKIYIDNDHILIIDYFRSFALYKYTSMGDFELIGCPSGAHKFDLGLLIDNFIVLSSNDDLFIYDKISLEIISQEHLGDKIIGIDSGQLHLDNRNDIFVFTQTSIIFCINCAK